MTINSMLGYQNEPPQNEQELLQELVKLSRAQLQEMQLLVTEMHKVLHELNPRTDPRDPHDSTRGTTGTPRGRV